MGFAVSFRSHVLRNKKGKWLREEIPAVTKRFCEQGCMSQKELYDYGRTAGRLYGWHVSDVELFDAELREMGVRRAPQSWQYGRCEVSS